MLGGRGGPGFEEGEGGAIQLARKGQMAHVREHARGHWGLCLSLWYELSCLWTRQGGGYW